MNVSAVVRAAEGRLVGNGDKQFEKIVTDSRVINFENAASCAFVALVGELFDGHNYIQQVIEKGVKVIVCSRIPDGCDGKASFIVVEDTLTALGKIASFHRSQFDIPVCAVTGSVGKTSTKEMIASVLERGFNVLKTEKNFNNEIGLPMTLLKMDENHTASVVEMGMRGLGQIKYLCGLAHPTMGVITNVGVAHMELLGSQENIFRAKLEVAAYLKNGASLILCGDDKMLSDKTHVCEVLKEYGSNPEIVYFGTGENCDYRAENIEVTEENKYSFDICTPHGKGRLTLNVLGRHNVLNALAAVAVGMEAGMKIEDCIFALENYCGDGIRQNIIKANGITVIDDTYNAGPESMRASLDVLHNLKGVKRRIAVLGDMLELGSESEKAHTEIGAYAWENGIDILITAGECMKCAADEFDRMGELKGKDICAIKTDNSDSAAQTLLSIISEGDAVLVKGSHSMHMEVVSKAVTGK